MRHFPAFIALLFLIHGLHGTSIESDPNCGHNYADDCVIEAIFGNLNANESVEVLVNCGKQASSLGASQFSKVDKIVWNGCGAPKDLPHLGLQRIQWKAQVKVLQIERFTISQLAAGTFEGFGGIESLLLQQNSIANLSSRCFEGLSNVKDLRMAGNNLKWIDGGVLSALPKLNTLAVLEPAQWQHQLLMADHQFAENQIVDNVALEIRFGPQGEQLVKHLVQHVRNISISKSYDEQVHDLQLDGDSIVEHLELNRMRCFIANLPKLKSFTLTDASSLHLTNLPSLMELRLHSYQLMLPETLFNGAFDKLEVIDLANNYEMNVDMNIFQQFPNLKVLNFSYSQNIKLDNFHPENMSDIQIYVNETRFECRWLQQIGKANFMYKSNFNDLNYKGLPCFIKQESYNRNNPDAEQCRSQVYELGDELYRLRLRNVILKTEIFVFVLLGAFMLGVAATLISIYAYNRRQMLKHQPFYHLLSDSMVHFVRPMDELRKDVKELIARRLPPTNYEHPISDRSNATTMTDVEDANIAAEEDDDIYEEIPQKGSL